jgi:hypothetical protein
VKAAGVSTIVMAGLDRAISLDGTRVRVDNDGWVKPSHDGKAAINVTARATGRHSPGLVDGGDPIPLS